MQLKDVKTMTFAERGREITRLRRAITRWARLRNNQKCHEEDDRLTQTVGIEKAGRITISEEEFKRNCDHYRARECRAGRLTNDLTQIEK